MNTDSSDLRSMSKHLEALSCENRRLRLGLLICFAMSALALYSGMRSPNPVHASLAKETDQIEASTVEADTISAHRFLVNGQNGVTMLLLATQGTPDQPILKFFGPEPMHPEGRVLRMTLGVTPDPDVSVYHAFGPLKNHNDQIFSLTFPHNEPWLVLRSGKGNLSGMNPGGLEFFFDEDRPSLQLRDSKGHTAALAPR